HNILFAAARHGQEPVLVVVQDVARTDDHAGDVHRHARTHNVEIRVAGNTTAREIVEAQGPHFGQVANTAIAHQTNGSEAGEEGRHHLSAVRRVIREASDLLEYDHRGLRRGLYQSVKLDKLLKFER